MSQREDFDLQSLVGTWQLRLVSLSEATFCTPACNGDPVAFLVLSGTLVVGPVVDSSRYSTEGWALLRARFSLSGTEYYDPIRPRKCTGKPDSCWWSTPGMQSNATTAVSDTLVHVEVSNDGRITFTSPGIEANRQLAGMLHPIVRPLKWERALPLPAVVYDSVAARLLEWRLPDR